MREGRRCIPAIRKCDPRSTLPTAGYGACLNKPTGGAND